MAEANIDLVVGRKTKKRKTKNEVKRVMKQKNLNN